MLQIFRRAHLRPHSRRHSLSFSFSMSMVSTATSTQSMPQTDSITDLAYRILITAEPATKVKLTQQAYTLWSTDHNVQHSPPTQVAPSHPARPSLPKIVAPCSMPSPKTCGLPSNIFYLHSLAHVELNAIDLCFDTFLRFHLPTHEWYEDWLSIAIDESRHFTQLSKRLSDLGYEYGCLPAHGLIWEGASATNHNRKERIAVGQLVAEARGLDAGERMVGRFYGLRDKESAAIVKVIAEEEVRHVQVGVKWFLRECGGELETAIKEFREIAIRVGNQGAFTPPFNVERRRMAGMEPDWYLPVAQVMKEMREQKIQEGKKRVIDEHKGESINPI